MKNNVHLIIGLGATGFSCVQYLASKNIPVIVVDTRENPPKLAECKKQFPKIEIYLGKFQEKIFEKANVIVVSPGISLEEPCIKKCIEKNIPVIGDVEIFARDAKAPIIAITGSNGKTTLTTLMGELIKNAGHKTIVCGNIGLPVLEALQRPIPDYYVIELSSFQLDTTYSLKAKVAVVINVSADHMDRYKTFDDYLHSKQRIYKNCEYAVVNADEPDIWKKLIFKNLPVSFTLKKPKQNEWGIVDDNLMFGDKKIIAISDLMLQERHNNQNFLVALAMGSTLKLPIENMLQTLKHFSGLPHRCQLVKKINGVAYYNDSKATNVGAAIAAIDSMSQHIAGRIILLAGGDSKGVDLTPLQNPVKKSVAHVILFGKDADLLQNTLATYTKISRVNNLREAIATAKKIAQSGDIVLLSPACSSLDQYENYAARGNEFIETVNSI
ncbi:MAG TPA: UDP-N-acetylmuramoyl-L-alanine--D-glutamate ligase [Coxiellaceae bacterium]|nr:MAG: UDP-N-acetylmuramoylalanine--D-glutamate ligase [Gammaproteobacteria bacterium RIFCSPHIGHO2_12_FULL_36_30]HLB56135.1 UDP-N-acetylmuramoyl-L-alanine--D-glutamate ligase [Coxiellaceae bacterium]